MLIKTIQLENLLSFGPGTAPLEMKPLSVLIGPNGSGKSNLIEAIGLLQAAPRDLLAPIGEGGGVGDWIWRGEPQVSSAKVEVLVNNPKGPQSLRYRLGIAKRGQRFELEEEQIENENPDRGHRNPYIFFERVGLRSTINYRDGKNPDGKKRELRPEEIDSEQSVLAQRKDPDNYPELTYLGEVFGRIRLYREWTFGRYTPPRLPQKADLPNNFLGEDGKNLGLVLNRLKREPKAKARILEALRKLYEGISDFDVIIEGGTVQVFFQEDHITIPATRLSDGTLRYLCLLAVLCDLNPPPLVCIEEPELGLHPDILPTLSDLLREASERCQIIVTTHSDVLVDALTDTPESVVVCEKHQGQTTMRRLDQDKLSDWLKSYSLGELWRKGELGGNRW